jgi:hypothetical protein
MFFLEKLLDKGGTPRSLHDLSCQFGTKGFSKSVRKWDSVFEGFSRRACRGAGKIK